MKKPSKLFNVVTPTKDIENGNYDPGKKSPQYFAALAASLAALSTGTVLAWLSQISLRLMNGELGFLVTEDELGWIGSLMPLGAACLSFFIGSACDMFGRKNSMLFMVVLMSVGWSQIIWAKSVIMLYIGRFVTGMVGGAYCVTVSLYTNEIAQKEIRGTLGCFTQVMISLGILLATVLGKCLSIIEFTLAVAMIPIIFGVIFAFMPESPVFLLRKGRDEEARRSLLRLRGENYNIEEEIKEIQIGLKQQEHDVSVSKLFLESLKKKGTRKAWLIGLGLMTFKILCGMDPITYYMSFIYESSGMDLDAQIGTIIFAFIQVASSFGQSMVVDRLGRKILLAISDGIMTLCLIVVGISLLLRNKTLISEEYFVYVDYLPLISLCIFTIAYSLGLGPIPFMMCAEVFPQEIKSFASSVCSTFCWFLAFAVVKAFVVVQMSWGNDAAFLTFAVFSFVGTFFMIFVVPETKGKSMNEIQEMLEGRQ